MAKKAKPPVSAKNRASISSRHLRVVDDLLEVLYARMVRGAFEVAFARDDGHSPIRVSTEDLHTSVQNVLSSAMAEFDNLSKPRETHHAPRRAS